jgi:D-3-phosphoglycerate dehydrogenase
MMAPDVLAFGAFPEETVDELERRFALTLFEPPPAPEQIPKHVRDHVRGLATTVNRGASAELIALLPKLEIISCFGVGLDIIDLAAARRRGIAVTNTPGLVVDDVADLAVGLMLASARQIVFADRFVRDGSWRKGSIPLGRSLGRKTVGVLGLGGIGRAIADRCTALRMQVIYSGPRRKPDAPYEYLADLIELARRSDYLMVACKGGPETRHLVSAAAIAALGPAGTLVNVARGSVVDEAALVAALADRRLGYAALDVFENAPNIRPELLALPNVIVQPHHGNATVETHHAVGCLMIENLVAHFEGRPLRTPVT